MEEVGSEMRACSLSREGKEKSSVPKNRMREGGGDDGSEDVVRVLRNSVMVGRLLVNLVRNNLRDVNIVIIILERLKRFELLLSLVFCCSLLAAEAYLLMVWL
jgi:hypothetical protein